MPAKWCGKGEERKVVSPGVKTRASGLSHQHSATEPFTHQQSPFKGLQTVTAQVDLNLMISIRSSDRGGVSSIRLPMQRFCSLSFMTKTASVLP